MTLEYFVSGLIFTGVMVYIFVSLFTGMLAMFFITKKDDF